METNNLEVIKLEEVAYNYKSPGGKVTAVKNASGSFFPGRTYAITGKSGSGKSTLLFLMAGLDLAQSGEIFFKGTSLKKLNRDNHRSHNIGIIFQNYNLLPNLTALENVQISLELIGKSLVSGRKIAEDLLARVGIDAKMARRRVLRLSGGEQQRVAIARALSSNPPLILADEPTGNLDSETGEKVIDLLVSLAKEDGKCVIIVSHSDIVAHKADEIWNIKDGILRRKTTGNN